jgi:hypothetical protein
MTASAAPEVLSNLLLCGLMGLVGQGARAAVGLKSNAANPPSQQSEFSAAYLLFSLMIGFIAGVLAGLPVLSTIGAISPDQDAHLGDGVEQ